MIARRFAHYEVMEKLGSGGMGDVYRARDLKLGRDVAIKFLPARFSADRMRLARFEQEARAASALNHPNLVTVHDVDRTDDGHPFIVMELVKGQTLRQALTPGKPLVTRRALELAAQATEGLAKAHAAGIVHRDLKPENLMVTEDGFVKIVDFGLAKLAVSDADSDADTAEHAAHDSATQDGIASPQTAAGVVLGTTGYMSPEQARGRPVDYRADQFACGAILYEMATGARAFRRETVAQTMAAIIEAEPEPISALNPRCPPPFRWIIERCLKKDPAERYASTLDLARELRTVCDRIEETSAASGPAPVAIVRRLRRSAAVLALGALLLAAAGAGLWRPLSDWLASRRVPTEKHLAVLPFTSTGDDSLGRALCDGMVETLASKLTRLQGVGEDLWIVPMSEVRAAGIASASAARRAFGVTLVVTGSAQLKEDRVSITANLVDARTLRQVRSTAPLDMPFSDASLLQDSLVAAVAGLLELELDAGSGRLLRQGGTQIAGAYDHYLRGRGHLIRFDDAKSLDLAIGAFQQAIQQDPRFALAYAGLGEAYWKQYELSSRPESVDLAQKACRRAIEINDLLAPVHVTLGILATGTGQPEAAEGHFRRALDLEPASADAQLGLARALEAGGKASDAEAVYRSALERRPGFWGGYSMLGTFYYKQGRYADAEREFRRVVELLPESPRAYNSLGGVYHLMGRTAEAIAMLEKSMAVGPTPAAASNLATVRFYSGDYTGAARAFEQVVTLGPADFWLWFNLASAYYWAPGERQRAEEIYRKAADLGEKARAINPRDAEQLAALAETYGHLGQEKKARQVVGEALRLGPLDGRVLFRAACLFEKLGERDRSLALIRRALANGYSTEEVARSPDLEGLRADPRFKG